jgi:septation ring formation regulator EzrA
MNKQTNEPNAVQTATAKLAALRQSLIDGDEKLTANDLAAARNALEFAELQESARQIAAQKATDAARRANLLDLQKQLTAVSNSRKSVDAKFTELEKSMADYLQTASTYQKKMNSIRHSVQAEFLNQSPLNPVPGLPTSDIRRVLTIGDVSAENYDPHEITKSLVERALADFDRNL